MIVSLLCAHSFAVSFSFPFDATNAPMFPFFLQPQEMDHSEGNFLVPALQRLCRAAERSTTESLRNAGKALWSTLLSKCSEESTLLQEEDDDDNEGIEDEGMEETDDEDGPAMVDFADVEASLLRSSKVSTGTAQQYPADHRNKYPLLFASMMSHEDIVMTCARALDEKVDVSVVREAAAYLEEVEAKTVNAECSG